MPCVGGRAMINSQQVQTLAERLLAPTYGFPFGQPQTAQLLVGGIPGDLPLDPPVPPGARVVGSVARHTEDRLANLDVLIDLPTDSDVGDVVEFYEREMPARGWVLAPVGTMGPHGGFQVGQPYPSRTFCLREEGPWISVVVAAPGGAVDVRLHLELTHPGPCAQPRGGEVPGANLLPSLGPPDGVFLRPVGGSFASDQAASLAVIEGSLPAVELERHFGEQLQSAGWERIDAGADGPMAWSRWRLPRQGAWHGSLTVLEAPGAQQRFLVVRVELAGTWGGGWIGSTSRLT